MPFTNQDPVAYTVEENSFDTIVWLLTCEGLE